MLQGRPYGPRRHLRRRLPPWHHLFGEPPGHENGTAPAFLLTVEPVGSLLFVFGFFVGRMTHPALICTYPDLAGASAGFAQCVGRVRTGREVHTYREEFRWGLATR